MPAKKQFQVYLEYFSVRFLSLFIFFIPDLFINVFSHILGNVLWLFGGKNKFIVLKNLELAFKNRYSEKEKRKIALSNFHYVVKVFTELLKFPFYSQKKIFKKTKIFGIENLDKALSYKKGVIVCSAHYGNWEWIAAYSALKGYPVNAIIRPLDNPLLNQLLTKTRESKGYKLLFRKLSIRKGVSCLKNNEILAVMYDQNAHVNGIFVPFFGVPASTMKGVTWFHQKTGAKVLCVHDHIEKNGSHSLVFSEMFTMSGNDYDDILKINHWFENVIEKDPVQYFWIHPKWKKRPLGEKSFYNIKKNKETS